MADRRMFSQSVVFTDIFLNMSKESQLLFFFLGLNADDDGFIGNPNMVLRQSNIGATALEELIRHGYVIRFKSGVIVLTHWRVANTVQADRRKATLFVEELTQLTLNDNKTYSITSCIQDVSKMDTDTDRNFIQSVPATGTQLEKLEERTNTPIKEGYRYNPADDFKGMTNDEIPF